MISKPMLADILEIDNDTHLISMKFPVLATPKLDGIRCLVKDNKVLSRKFIEIPNHHVRHVMRSLPNGLDGELMINGSFNQAQSAFMSENGEPNFTYNVFDYVASSLERPYRERMYDLEKLVLPSFCNKILPKTVSSASELLAYEAECLAAGYEGIMIRRPDGPYKCGRSTSKEAYLLKVKRFQDSEAIVIGFEEQLHNANVATTDELGHTKRSKNKAGLIPADTLGKFLVREIGNAPWQGKEFAIGTGEGLTAELRKTIWLNRDQFLNRIVTYKYQVHGIKDLPRLPIWKGFRDRRDM